jgi:hypothetical protein
METLLRCDPPPDTLLLQNDASLLRRGMGPVEKRGRSHGAGMMALGLGGQFAGEDGALVAVGAEEAHFHEFVRRQQAFEFGYHGWRDAGVADFERRAENLPESTEACLLAAS